MLILSSVSHMYRPTAYLIAKNDIFTNTSVYNHFRYQHSSNCESQRTYIAQDTSSRYQCSIWTGTHRNGVPVREMDRCNRSVSSRYARTHQNAVPVRHFSIIITFSTMKSVAD